jgi:hypothetical protein
MSQASLKHARLLPNPHPGEILAKNFLKPTKYVRGFFVELQIDYELIERKQTTGDKLKDLGRHRPCSRSDATDEAKHRSK